MKKENSKKRKIEVPEDIFKGIILHDEEKWIIKRALESEKPVHILLAGESGSGKSLFLWCISQLDGAKHYAAGGTISKAGIIEALLEEPTILIIDELDKMDKDDMSVLLSLMESGLVTKKVHDQEIRLRLDTRVYAACNYVHKLPKELRSRFLILSFRPYTREEFLKVSVPLLVDREGVDENLAKYIAESLVSFTRDVRDAIKVARLARCKEDVDRIVKIIKRSKEDLLLL